MMHGVEEGGYADEKIRTDIDGDTECGCFIVYITEE
jgi:hypothetical protein